MDSKTYILANHGCDDTTFAVIELTDDELAIVLRVVNELNKHSTYGCMPTIGIYIFDEKVEIHERRIDLIGATELTDEHTHGEGRKQNEP